MPELITIHVNGRRVQTQAGTMLAAALIDAGDPALRRSLHDEPRGPVCGMGICFECLVHVEGDGHVRACRVIAEPDMKVRTHV